MLVTLPSIVIKSTSPYRLAFLAFARLRRLENKSFSENALKINKSIKECDLFSLEFIFQCTGKMIAMNG